MAQMFQILVIGFRGEKKTVDVSTSEDEFNKTTISVFKEKLMVKFPELKGGFVYSILIMTSHSLYYF